MTAKEFQSSEQFS